MMHTTNRDWPFFRQVAREILWPKIDAEYQQELQGIAEGLNARTGSALDVYDIVAINSFEEVLTTILAEQSEKYRMRRSSSGAVRRLYELDQRRPDRHRPQQLDELRKRRTLASSSTSTHPAIASSWTVSRRDRQRR
jgi:hypothetical protein